METVAKSIIERYKVNVKPADYDHVTSKLADHLDCLVFNVCALANIVIVLNCHNRLKKEHMSSIRKYIDDKCDGIMSGGSVSMPSDFYGYPHPSYSAGNQGSDMLNVNFATGVARPEHSLQTGGRGIESVMHDSVYVRKCVKTRMKSAMSSRMMPELLSILDAKVACLAKDLVHKKVDLHRIDTIFKMKRHFVFN